MANIYVSELGVPKRYRNGKIYGGNSFNTTGAYESSNAETTPRHVETGRIEYVTGDSKTITITFIEAFEKVPVMVQLKVMRIVANVFQDVLFYLNSATFSSETGFEIFIDASEDINGVILNYNFTE